MSWVLSIIIFSKNCDKNVWFYASRWAVTIWNWTARPQTWTMCCMPTMTGGGISAILSRASDKNVSRGRMASTGTDPRQQTLVCGLLWTRCLCLLISEINISDINNFEFCAPSLCRATWINYLYANFTWLQINFKLVTKSFPVLLPRNNCLLSKGLLRGMKLKEMLCNENDNKN